LEDLLLDALFPLFPFGQCAVGAEKSLNLKNGVSLRMIVALAKQRGTISFLCLGKLDWLAQENDEQ